MQNQIKKNKSRINNYVKWILIYLSMQLVIFYYIDQGNFPRILLYFTYFASFILPTILIFNERIRKNVYRELYLIIFGLIFIISFIYRSDDLGLTIAGFAIYSHLLSAYFLKRFDILFFSNILKIVAILALGALLFFFSTTAIDFKIALARGYAWTELFFYATLFWGVIPYVIISTLTKKNIALSLFYWLGAIAINLLFLKRFIIIDSCILIVIIYYINSFSNKKLFNNFKYLLFVSFVLILVLFYASENIILLIEGTTSRIQEASDNIALFDRYIESYNYFSNANLIEIIFGKGFVSTHNGLYKDSYALHIGWSNFIFKGGIFLFVLVLTPYFRLFKLMKNIKILPLNVQFAVVLLLSYFFRLFYTNMHSLGPEMLIFFYAVFIVMDYSLKPKFNST